MTTYDPTEDFTYEQEWALAMARAQMELTGTHDSPQQLMGYVYAMCKEVVN